MTSTAPNGMCGDTRRSAWISRVPDATSYIVTIANDKDFTNIAHVYTDALHDA